MRKTGLDRQPKREGEIERVRERAGCEGVEQGEKLVVGALSRTFVIHDYW